MIKSSMSTSTISSPKKAKQGQITVKYSPILLEPGVTSADFLPSDDAQLRKLKQTLLQVMRNYQDDALFKGVVLPNILRLFQKKMAIHDAAYHEDEQVLAKTIDQILTECAFMQEKINSNYTCDKSAENSPNLIAHIQRKNRKEQLATRIETKKTNLQYLVKHMGDIVVTTHELNKYATLVPMKQGVIKHVNAVVAYASTYNRMVKAFRAVLMYTNRITVVQYLIDLLLSWFNNPMKIFKEYNNVVVMGEPGAGKTVLANALAQLFGTLGIVADVDFRKDNTAVIKEHTASNFIAQYAGQTGPKTLAVLNDHLEKVLFIDEAYAIMNSADIGGDGAGYGEEAVTEIVNFLSTHIGTCVVIMAGYEEQMQDFLVSNVGLQRRFPHKIILGKVDAAYASTVFGSLMASYNPRYDSRAMQAKFRELYQMCQELYTAKVNADNKGKAKFMARTLFGNGVGSIVNFAAKVQKMIELCGLKDTEPLPACVVPWTIGLHTTLTANATVRDPYNEADKLRDWYMAHIGDCGNWYDHIRVNTAASVSDRMSVFNADVLNNTTNGNEIVTDPLLTTYCDQDAGVCMDNVDAIKAAVLEDLGREGGPKIIKQLTRSIKVRGKHEEVEKTIASVDKGTNRIRSTTMTITFTDGETFKAIPQYYMRTWYPPPRLVIELMEQLNRNTNMNVNIDSNANANANVNANANALKGGKKAKAIGKKRS
jgi:hypothetical protein